MNNKNDALINVIEQLSKTLKLIKYNVQTTAKEIDKVTETVDDFVLNIKTKTSKGLDNGVTENKIN